MCVGANSAHTDPTGIHTAEELLTKLINIPPCQDQALGVKDLTPLQMLQSHAHKCL